MYSIHASQQKKSFSVKLFDINVILKQNHYGNSILSKECLNIRTENLFKNHIVRNKSNRGNPSLTLNDVTIKIPIHDDSYSVSHAETPSTVYDLQTPSNSPIVSTIPETQELITNVVNDFSFTKVTSPEESLTWYKKQTNVLEEEC